jgi:hypothetical protein
MRAIRVMMATTALLGAALMMSGCSGAIPGGFGGGGCGNTRDTQYIPSRSWATFERDGVRISVHRNPYKTLTVVVTSSDGRYQDTNIDPTTDLADGLEVTTKMGFDWVWDYYKREFVQTPGQVRPLLRVGSCWTYIDGPSDLF